MTDSSVEAVARAHYYVSGVVVTTAQPAYFQVMEEADGKQKCIATVPFHKAINPAAKGGRDGARKDAEMIVRALNAAALPPPEREPRWFQDEEMRRHSDELSEREPMREALEFYANEWEQDVDAEQTIHGWEGRVGRLEPTQELLHDAGGRARAALAPSTAQSGDRT